MQTATAQHALTTHIERPVFQRRQSTRHSANGTAIIRIKDCSDPAMVDKLMRCAVLDISETGMRLEISVMIPSDADLTLWVNLTHYAKGFFLRGTAQWVSFEENGEFNTGIELRNESNVAYADWVRMFNAPVLTEVVPARTAH